MMGLWARLLGIPEPGSVAGLSHLVLAAGAAWPLWAIVLLVLVGLAAALLNWLPQITLPWKTRLALTVLRLGGVALLVLMALQAELSLRLVRNVRPTVALMTDASASMDVRDEGGRTRREVADALGARLMHGMETWATVVPYAFADRAVPGRVTPALPGATRLGACVADVLERERDLQAIMLLSDGHDTGGDRGNAVAPLLAARGIAVYPVLLGGTNAPPRAEVRLDRAAPYVRLGDELTLGARVEATGLGEQAVRLSLYEEGSREPLAVRENVRLGAAAVPVTFTVKPASAGLRRYRIVMEGVKGTSMAARLAATHAVQVVDARIRVLYLDIPRDERKILGYWLARDPVVDLATLTLLPKGGWYGQGALRHKDVGEGLPAQEADLYQYDVIVFGDIPRSYFRQGGDVAETRLRWLTEFVARRGGGLVTLGGRSAYGAGGYADSVLGEVLPFDTATTGDGQWPGDYRAEPTPVGLAHPLMQLAAEAAATRDAWFELPTLDGCNRVGAARPGASVLAVRPGEGGVAMPLIAIQDVGKGKVLSLAADTTWRWEMLRGADAPDHFRRFWGNAVRHLAPDPRLEPNRPQIMVDSAQPAVGEVLHLSTRLVDPLYQPVAGADLRVDVTSPTGHVRTLYPRDDRQRRGVYTYQVALDVPGDWLIKVTHKEQVTEQVVRAGENDDELDDPRARADLVAELAAAAGGRVCRAADAGTIADAIAAVPRTVEQAAVVPLWNLPATLVLFVAIVCVDCLIRKRRGLA